MGLLTNIARRTVGHEDAGTLENPNNALYDALDIEPQVAGVTVNAETGLEYPPVFRALSIISGDVMKLPLIVYQREGEGKRRAVDHQAYRLLKYQWHDTLTSAQGKRYVQKCATWRGNGYAFIQRNNREAPTGIYPMPPEDVSPYKANGKTWYMHWPSGDTLKWKDVLHIRGLGTELVGYSLVDKAKESLGLGLAAQKYGAAFFENSGTPHVVFTYPGEVTPEMRKNIKASWQKRHGGPGQSFKTAVLEEGMEVESFPINNDELQFLETREFEIRQVANWFNLPPHKLGDDSRTSYNSLEQENQSYLDDCLSPWLTCWESQCRAKLLTEIQKDRDTHDVEFILAALLRANLQARGDYYEKAVRNGWMQRDEIRARENMNPLPQDIGEAVTVEKNMTIIDGNGEVVPTESEDGEGERLRIHKDLVRAAVSRMCKRLARHIESHGTEELREKHEHVLRDAIYGPVRALNSVQADTHDPEHVVDIIFEAAREEHEAGNVDGFIDKMPNAVVEKISDA